MKLEIPLWLVSSSISSFINKRTIKYVITPTSIEKLTPVIQLVSNSLEFLLNHNTILSCILGKILNPIANKMKTTVNTKIKDPKSVSVVEKPTDKYFSILYIQSFL